MADTGLSLELLTRFALEDVHNVLRDETISADTRLAYGLYRDELRRAVTLLADRHVARSGSGISFEDEIAILALLNDEQRAARDHQLAAELHSSRTQLPTHQHTPDNGHSHHNRVLISESISALAGPLQQLDAAHYQIQSPRLVRCVACDNDFLSQDTLLAPCSHRYCRGCLTSVISSATKDEQLFPPRCCKEPFITADLASLIPHELFHLLESKAVEFTTTTRTYCSDANCSSFIRPEFIDENIARCPQCLKKTCTICNTRAHQDQECPEDPYIKLLFDTAREESWQQCFRCKRLVSISHGCNHMTCRCKAEFCYECAKPWKSCECALFHEGRLLDQAQRNLQARQPERVGNAQALQEEVRRVATHHDCTHAAGFEYREVDDDSIGTECELCDWEADVYLWGCRSCDLEICGSCKRNRL